jgi:hypothetical protein
MKLSDLNPEFYRYDRRMTEVDICLGDSATWRDRGCPVDHRVEPRDVRVPSSFADAQCLFFVCPKCAKEAGSVPGCHYIEVTFADRGVLADQGVTNKRGEYVRWNVSGTGFNDLTITQSILIESGCEWHGYITNGDAS